MRMKIHPDVDAVVMDIVEATDQEQVAEDMVVEVVAMGSQQTRSHHKAACMDRKRQTTMHSF